MKQLEELLQRYAEGVITPEEQSELFRLTHRDDVLQAASNQATKIRRRRNAIASTVASVILVAGFFFTLTNTGNQSTSQPPLLAQTDPIILNASPADSPIIEPSSIPASNTTIQSDETAFVQDQTTAKPVTAPVPSRTITEHVQPQTPIETEPIAHITSDPVVACNTQCSPDSVINDIWNFLKA